MPDDFSQMNGQPCRGMTAKECARWLIHDDAGRAWANERLGTMSMAQIVANLVNLSANAAAEANKHREVASSKRKREAPMNGTTTILKNARALGEHGMTALITDYAKRLYPTMTREAAFVKCFTEDSPQGRALRTVHAVSKGQVVDADGPESEYGLGSGRGVSGGALDPDEVNEAAADETNGDDVMALLERLAAALRVRDPSMTKAAAFTKAYIDNPHLAAMERRTAYRKLGVVA
jgi:hypothetical protein